MKDNEKNIEPWKLVSSKTVFSAKPWVELFVDKVKLPSGRVVDDYYRIALPDYAMVCARDKEGRFLLQRQYRHALSKVTISFPTGCMEEGETPLETAKREFLEETGYWARMWESKGSYMQDGNKGCGTAHFFIAEELEKVADPEEDDMEETEIIFIEPNKVAELIINGEIQLVSTVALLSIAMISHKIYNL